MEGLVANTEAAQKSIKMVRPSCQPGVMTIYLAAETAQWTLLTVYSCTVPELDMRHF